MSGKRDSDSLRYNNPYSLLKEYALESKILSLAYSYREGLYRSIHQNISYPLVILTSVSSVFSGLDMNRYMIMVLSLITLCLIGMEKAIDPKTNEFQALNIKNEFSEINQSIVQFVKENNKSSNDIKQFSKLIYEQMKIWKSLAPPIREKYIVKATGICTKKIRKHTQISNIDIPVDIKKNEILLDITNPLCTIVDV